MPTARALAIAVLVTACGDLSSPAPEDAADARATDARLADAAAGPLDGPWSLGWTCNSGCETRPALTFTRSLGVAGLTLTYSGGLGGGGERHLASGIVGNCLDVPAVQVGQVLRTAYRLCRTGNLAETVISWSLGGAPASWRLQGAR